jgi:hypothetical protein
VPVLEECQRQRDAFDAQLAAHRRRVSEAERAATAAEQRRDEAHAACEQSKTQRQECEREIEVRVRQKAKRWHSTME